MHVPAVYAPQLPVTPVPKLANSTPSMTASGPQEMTPDVSSGIVRHSIHTATVGGAGAIVVVLAAEVVTTTMGVTVVVAAALVEEVVAAAVVVVDPEVSLPEEPHSVVSPGHTPNTGSISSHHPVDAWQGPDVPRTQPVHGTSGPL